jgi:hypothetical protein
MTGSQPLGDQWMKQIAVVQKATSVSSTAGDAVRFPAALYGLGRGEACMRRLGVGELCMS